MLCTITIGSSISVQGQFIAQRDDGRVMIKVDNQIFVGQPVSPKPLKLISA